MKRSASINTCKPNVIQLFAGCKGKNGTGNSRNANGGKGLCTFT